MDYDSDESDDNDMEIEIGSQRSSISQLRRFVVRGSSQMSKVYNEFEFLIALTFC